VGFDELLKKSKDTAYSFPTEANLSRALGTTPARQKQITQNAENTRPILHSSVVKLIHDFLAYKKRHGTYIEESIYDEMSATQFVQRCLTKRPLVFMGASDTYLLRDGKTRGSGGFEFIADGRVSMNMRKYLSYDELAISALIGVSVPTFFINDGNRMNKGLPGKPGTFEEQGIYIGQVGARFEKKGEMEYAHMIITPQQNTTRNGYGGIANNDASERLGPFARFYGQGSDEKCFFPGYREAAKDVSGKYIEIGTHTYLNVSVYKQRMRTVIEPFLIEANERAKQQDKKAYVHAVGLGLGVWQISDIQNQLLVDVYADVINEIHLENISDIDFSWFGSRDSDGKSVNSIDLHCANKKDGEALVSKNNNIKIHFSLRNPAEKLTEENEGKLLVAQYAWDGGSYPGNEYWLGSLTASSDPAAACCSQIPELQNPDINPKVSGENALVIGDECSLKYLNR